MWMTATDLLLHRARRYRILPGVAVRDIRGHDKICHIVIRYIYIVVRDERARRNNVKKLHVLAEFRHELRKFLQFSEHAACRVNLPPQQHQLLLQVAGAPEGTAVTVAYAAERLGLRHNSVGELINRCEEAGLISRSHDGRDRRCVLLQITPAGDRILEALSEDHARELSELGPRLVAALNHIQSLDKAPREAGRQEHPCRSPLRPRSKKDALKSNETDTSKKSASYKKDIATFTASEVCPDGPRGPYGDVFTRFT
jgi:Transcriptional regulators